MPFQNHKNIRFVDVLPLKTRLKADILFLGLSPVQNFLCNLAFTLLTSWLQYVTIQ